MVRHNITVRSTWWSKTAYSMVFRRERERERDGWGLGQYIPFKGMPQ
jgi:hypothetical protein